MRWHRSGIVVLVLALTGCTPFSATTAAHETSAAPTTAAAPSSSSAAPSVRSAAPSHVSAPTSATVPVIAPRPTPARPTPVVPVNAPVVVLDPGHNGGNAAHPATINAPVPDGRGGTKPCNTTGTATNAGYPEHAFTWDVALRMRSLLQAAGVHVVMTRPDDVGVGPCVDVRGRLGATVGAAAFVGIHGDGAAPGGHGFHVITSSLAPAGPRVASASAGLARTIRDAMTAVEPVSNYLGSAGLDPRSDLAGLNLNAVPAVYVECGNMRNAGDAAWMSSASGREAVARRLAAGVLTFLGR
ncbi:MAG: N-acetylmuramoyl-L-alanine amidase [Blastococcus sp.]